MSLWGKVKKGVKKAVKKVVKTVKKVVRVAKELAWRIVSAVDFMAAWLGLRPTKYLRLRVYILPDLKNRLVQDEPVVQAWVDETKRIFKDRMKIEIISTNRYFPIVSVVPEVPPPELYGAVMNPDCGVGHVFSDASDYFDDMCRYQITGNTSTILDLLGYGDALFAFIVSSVANGDKNGCAFPPVHDYCLIENNPRPTTIAHEIGHLGWLRHRSAAKNLMNPNRGDHDAEVTRTQIASVRASRYVTYLRVGD